MGLLDGEIVATPRKVMTLFYLVDTSGSMAGTKIGTVNSAMEECLPLLRDVAAVNDDAEIKVAVMQFSSGCSWITPESGPVSLDDLKWTELTAGGITDFGAALLELDKRLSRKEFLKSQTGAYAPVILLLSDGEPTDDWESALRVLQENNWYKHALKIAIDIESGSNRDVLSKFTNNVEAILDAKDKNTLKKMIKKVSVRASEFQSHSKPVNADDPTKVSTAEEEAGKIVHDIENEMEWDKW